MAAQVLDENKYIATVTFDSQWEINDKKEAITGGQGEIVFVVSRIIPNIQGCAKVYRNVEDAKREFNYAMELQHPALLKMKTDLIYKEHVGAIIVWDERTINLLEKSMLSEDEASSTLFAIVHCLAFLHKKKLIHSDIKPQNIVLSQRDRAYLIDLGFMVSEGNMMLGGTPVFMPPEFAKARLELRRSSQSTAVDMWALGITIVQCISGTLFFAKREEKKTKSGVRVSTVAELMERAMIIHPTYSIESHKFEAAKANLAKLMESATIDSSPSKGSSSTWSAPGPAVSSTTLTPMTTTSDSGRDVAATYEAITGGLTSSFFMPLKDCSPELLDLITRLLEFYPNYRIKAKEALHHPWFRSKRMDWLQSKQGKADRIQDDNEEIERKISAYESEIGVLGKNDAKRRDPNSVPVYLIIKRRKQAGIPGRHIKEYYAPKPIWATCAEEIENWIRQLSGPDAPTTKIKIVANAKEALDCIPDLDISELKHANIAEINCLVVLY